MKITISKVLITVFIFAFLSCSDDGGPQLIENSNNERHVFVLEQGQSFDYDMARSKFFFTSGEQEREEVNVYKLTSTSIGEKVNIDGKLALRINNTDFIDSTIFSQATHLYSDESGLEIYTESISDLNHSSNYTNIYYPLKEKWLRIIDFNKKEWISIDSKDTISIYGRTYERKYEVFGKRINVTEITYDGEVFDALNIDLVYKHEIKELESSSPPEIKQLKTNILSVGEVGIYQLKTSSGIVSNDFLYSILSDDNF